MKKVALIAAFAAIALTGCIDKGKGEKLGVLTKLAEQGAVFPTWEAELVRGGLVGGSGVNGAAFHFTIEDPALVKQLQDALENQKEVKIEYRTEMFAPFRSESGNHFLTKLTIIEPKPATGGAALPGNVSGKIVDLLKVQAELIKELVNQQAAGAK